MSKLVIVRHGQSQWNLENRFTGWVDIELSPKEFLPHIKKMQTAWNQVFIVSSPKRDDQKA